MQERTYSGIFTFSQKTVSGADPVTLHVNFTSTPAAIGFASSGTLVKHGGTSPIAASVTTNKSVITEYNEY